MRRAILYVLLAVMPALCYAADDPKPKPREPVPQQQQPPPESPQTDPKKAPPVPESISPLIPVGQTADSAKPETTGTPETDPAKMAGSPDADKASKAVSVNQKTYTIGAEDVLIVKVWGNAELSGSSMVRPDGKISIPLIGDVTAAGLSPEQLETAIRDRLRENVLHDPQVSINLQQVNSKKYYINGRVLKPGMYSLVVPTTVLEGLVNAGGFQDFADEKHITILRGSKVFPFNYKDVSKGKHLEQNIPLEPGDQIFVK